MTGTTVQKQVQDTHATTGPPWLRRLPQPGSVGLVALAAVFTLLLRLPFVTKPLSPDEAGLLIIAQNWSEGPFLYGDYFVGRGIAVIALYALGDAVGGWLGIRIVGMLAAVTMVVAAGWAGHQLRGRRGAGWAALLAASYSSTYAFSSAVTNERLIGAAVVMTSCAVTLSAARHPGSVARATLAGVLATLPILMVQSYVDALVFAAVLLLASVVTRRLDLRAALRVALGGVLGMLLTLGALAVLFATTWMTWEQFWFQMVGYRVEASYVVREGADMPVERLRRMGEIVVFTGVVVVLVGLLAGIREIRRRSDLLPVWFAILAMLGLTLASMVAGGDFWPDYLLQAIPELAMAMALVAPSGRWPGVVARFGALVAAVAAVGAVYMGLQRPILGTADNEGDVGRWLAEAKEPDDTATVVFGKANVLHHAGMTTPYPYLWSLLTRTLDPDLDLLAETLSGPEAPTWLVAWHGPDTWELDSDDRVDGIIRDRYAFVGSPCGKDVYLLRGETRDRPPTADCGSLD